MLKSILLASLLPFAAQAATLEIVNQTGGRARIAELFNVCQGYLVPSEQPLWLENGESRLFEVPLVMHHYKICGGGMCSATAIQLKEGDRFQLVMEMDGSLINGRPTPDQWGGPTNPCPAL